MEDDVSSVWLVSVAALKFRFLLDAATQVKFMIIFEHMTFDEP